MSIPQYTLADMDIARRLWMASDADGTIQSDELARARFYHDQPRKLTASQISTVFEDLTGKPWDSERMLDLVGYSQPQHPTEYSEYTLPVTNEPSYYGIECTESEATRIAESIGRIAQEQFPGLNVEMLGSTGRAGVRGHVVAVCDEIERWVQDNWTSVL